MVSLENRADYSLRINQSEKLTAFNNLLLGKANLLFTNQEMNLSDEIYFGLVNAIQTEDKATFEKFYNKKNKSHPSKESPSPFVNDDFLIFCLIVGISKFGLDKIWIKEIVSLRNRNAITITLENILNENYYSKSNLYEIVLMYFKFNNPSLITNDFMNNTFKRILEYTSIFENKSDFQIMCAISSYDLIIVQKVALDGSEIDLLKQFNLAFLKRVKILAWIIQTFILITLISYTIVFISNYPEIKTFFDKIGSVLKIFGIVGISQLGNIFPAFKRISNEILLRILGYPAKLIKKSERNLKIFL
jgi:hypothetical protein